MLSKNKAIFTLGRAAFHTASVQHYQINYEQLRKGTEASGPRPLTVRGNVKNVQGWRGGAERGFLAAYPDCIHVLTQEGTMDIPDMARWYRKVLTHNLATNVLKQRYGILVPITYRHLVSHMDKELMNQAHVLGWTVEMIRAAAILTTETVAQHSSTRYGFRRSQDRQTWAEKHDLGNKAFNDALLIDRGIWVLLKHYFGKEASIYYEPITRAQRNRALGRALGYSLLTIDEDIETRMDDFTMNNYKALTRSHVSQTNYCLPVSLALHLAGKHEPKLHELAHSILHEMGYYVEVSRDYSYHFHNENGTDIPDGRLTCLIVLALQRATPEQRTLLYENYGFPDEAKVQVVKKIYKEQKLKKIMEAHIDQKKVEILNRIQGISKLDKAGIGQEFFFKLMESMDMNDIA